MNITEAYYLAHKARAKLASETARPSHNLRLLVGHANLLDSLMLKLADAEHMKTSWLNQSILITTKSQDRHTRWTEVIVEEPEDCCDMGDADLGSSSGSESECDDNEQIEPTPCISLSPQITLLGVSAEHTFEDCNDKEDYAKLALTRSPSHSVQPLEFNKDFGLSDHYYHRRLSHGPSRPTSKEPSLQRSPSTLLSSLSLDVADFISAV